jgi:lipopolysaccharide export LptBFGC system permease protein LptF
MRPESFEMWFSIGLFCSFAVISAVGAYLIAAHHRSRKAGAVVAVLILLFFVALGYGVATLMKQGGVF